VPVPVPVEPPTVSQFPVEVGASLNVTADPALVVTITVCAAGAFVLPSVAVKLRPVELKFSVGMAGGMAVTTLRVTETVCGLFETPVAANETLPVHVVPAERPVATKCTVALRGVGPEGLSIVNQLFPQDVVETVPVTVTEAPLLVTVTGWSAGSAPLTVAVMVVGVTVNVGVVTTAGVMVYVLALMFDDDVAPARLKVTVPTLVAGGVQLTVNDVALLVSSIY
jgi:hypothetical protein